MLYRIIIHLNQLCSPLGSFVRLKAITFRLDPHKHQKEKLAVSNICIILVLFTFPFVVSVYTQKNSYK